MTKREVWIDIAKGLAILLVIMGHSSAQAMYRDAVPIASLIYNCIYAFHMPLFFFLSGLVYKRKNKFASELKKKIEKLLVPSLVFSTPFILSQVMRDIRSGSNILTACLGQVKHIFLGQGHYWFITFLFIIQITAFFLGDNAKRNVVVGVLTGIYSILFISLEINPYILRIPFYAFYFLLGQLIGPNNLIATLKKNMVQKW